MEQSVAILGRQPALGRAELESLYGAKSLQPVGQQAALLNMPASQLPMSRLGGTVKAARLLSSINSTDWPRLIKYIADNLPQYLRSIPEGKIRFGLSVYGLPTKPEVTTDLGKGAHLIEGMKFNMPGWWTLTVSIEGPSGDDTATFNLVL